jgi:hypothetical protein
VNEEDQMTNEPPGGTPEPYQPPDPYQPAQPYQPAEPYQPAPAYDPTAAGPYQPPDPYQPANPYQQAEQPPYQPPPAYPAPDAQGAQPSGVPFSGQPYSGQPYSGQPYSGQPYSGQPFSGQPYGGPQAFGTPQYGAAPYPPYGPGYAVRGTNGLAIASLVCALAGLVTCIGAPLGIVLGHIAKNQIKVSGEDGDGLATAGLVVGYVLSAIGVLFCGLWVTGAIFSSSFGP